MDKLKIVTLQTDRNEALDNWIYTAKSNQYDYAILGLDEEWKGWSWRTKQYLKYIQSLSRDATVCITDCNDILFVKLASELWLAWNWYREQGKEIVFGGESTCCTGDYRYYINPTGNNAMVSKVKAHGNNGDVKNQNRWMFPNAGCVIGTRDKIIEALTLAKDANDDQARYLEMYSENPKWLTIDHEHKIVGNLNALNYMYQADTYLPQDYYNSELKYWDIVEQYPHLTRGDLTMVNPPPTFYQLKNKQTGGTPCIAHFPGKNYVLYNHIGKELFKGNFKVLPFEDKRTSLWSIANIWK